jgi:hypothetical protein
MRLKIAPARRALTGRAVGPVVGRYALAAVGAGFCFISTSTIGADLATGSTRSITGPSQVTHTDHRPITVQPNAPPDTKLDYLAAHVRIVDRLYEELMRWTPPGCSSAATDASMARRC